MTYEKLSLERFLSLLGSVSPVPGGGSASAIVGAVAVSLAQKVAAIYSRRLARKGKKDPEIGRLLTSLGQMKKSLVRLADRDARAYEAVVQATRSKRKGERLEHQPVPFSYKKNAKIRSALLQAFRVQGEHASLLAIVLGCIRSLSRRISGSIQSDLQVSEALLKGAFTGARATAWINLRAIQDKAIRMKLKKEWASVERGFRHV